MFDFFFFLPISWPPLPTCVAAWDPRAQTLCGSAANLWAPASPTWANEMSVLHLPLLICQVLIPTLSFSCCVLKTWFLWDLNIHRPFSDLPLVPSTSFTAKHFYWFRIQSGSSIAFSGHYSLVSSYLWQSSRLCLSWPWHVLSLFLLNVLRFRYIWCSCLDLVMHLCIMYCILRY